MEERQDVFTEDELDILSGMFIVFLHAAERCITLTERHYEAAYRKSRDYQKLCKIYGKAKADELLGNKVKSIVRGDEKNKIRLLLEAANTFKQRMERVTINAAESHVDGVTFTESFDALQHDVNYLCRIYAMMVNCNGKDDEVMVESTIKALAKGKRCTEKLIKQFQYNYAEQ